MIKVTTRCIGNFVDSKGDIDYFDGQVMIDDLGE